MNGIQKTRKEAERYAAEMEKIHGDGVKWFVFEIPKGSLGREWGRFACCRASERNIYEAGGARFI